MALSPSSEAASPFRKPKLAVQGQGLAEELLGLRETAAPAQDDRRIVQQRRLGTTVSRPPRQHQAPAIEALGPGQVVRIEVLDAGFFERLGHLPGGAELPVEGQGLVVGRLGSREIAAPGADEAEPADGFRLPPGIAGRGEGLPRRRRRLRGPGQVAEHHERLGGGEPGLPRQPAGAEGLGAAGRPLGRGPGARVLQQGGGGQALRDVEARIHRRLRGQTAQPAQRRNGVVRPVRRRLGRGEVQAGFEVVGASGDDLPPTRRRLLPGGRRLMVAGFQWQPVLPAQDRGQAEGLLGLQLRLPDVAQVGQDVGQG